MSFEFQYFKSRYICSLHHDIAKAYSSIYQFHVNEIFTSWIFHLDIFHIEMNVLQKCDRNIPYWQKY